MFVEVVLVLSLEYLKVRDAPVLNDQCNHRIRTNSSYDLFLFWFIFSDLTFFMLRQIVSSHRPIFSIATILNFVVKFSANDETNIVLKSTHHLNRSLCIDYFSLISYVKHSLCFNEFFKVGKYQLMTLSCVVLAVDEHLFGKSDRTIR